MAISQQNRPIQVATPLGEDKLLFYRMRGTEKLGELFTLGCVAFHICRLRRRSACSTTGLIDVCVSEYPSPCYRRILILLLVWRVG